MVRARLDEAAGFHTARLASGLCERLTGGRVMLVSVLCDAPWSDYPVVELDSETGF